MKKVIHEPLLYFLLLGAGLFGVHTVLNMNAAVSPADVVVSAGQVESLTATFTKVWQRPPTAEELKGQVDQYVKEEILSREAIKLGLDQNDTVIRRRLQQKMEFIAEDFAAATEPTEAELAGYLAKHPERFALEQRFTFRQAFLNPQRRGEKLDADTAALLAKLRQDPSADIGELGDALMLPQEFTSEPQQRVVSQFGPEFASALAESKAGEWSGPIPSGYGAHLVLVTQRTEGRLPALDHIRDQVRTELMNARRVEANQRFLDTLLAKYHVTIQGPSPRTGAVGRADNDEPMNALRSLSMLVCCAALASSAAAHEVRPAYLEVKQTAPDIYDVLWKVPASGGDQRLAIYVQFPSQARELAGRYGYFSNNAYIERWRIQLAGGLDGQAIHIDGLSATKVDVLARIERASGLTQTARVLPGAPDVLVERAPSRWDVSATYLRLGVEHILMGIDHLLYILAMLFLVKGWRRIVATMTAFTLTHSITLSAAALGYVHVPGPPVEALIALSIVFVAREIALARRGKAGLTQQWPWVISFTFGLLHGFGFAGALSEVGLPAHAIPFALLFFNVGVEIGQLVFVAAVLGVFSFARRVPAPASALGGNLAPYAIGSVAMFWVIQRIAAF